MTTELSIKGLITAQTAEVFLASLSAVKGDVVVRIDSDGGDMIQGFRMHHAIRARGNVDTVIDGRAASAATLPFLAGRKRSMPRGSYLVIHNPWNTASGDASAMRNNADMLEKARVDMVETYMAATGLQREAVEAMMDAETWLDAASAVQGRWATEVANGQAILASLTPGQFRNAPKAAIRASITAAPESARASFRKGIQQVEDGKAGDGLEPATVKEARSLADGELPTEAKIRKANAWWGRNERFLQAEADSPADVAANLWGGPSGRDWFASLYAELEEDEDEAEESIEDKLSLSIVDGKQQTMTAQLLALLGIKPTAREDFLASAITALGVTPEAVSAALDSGKSGFVADHIQAAISAVKAEADKLRPEASLLADVRASLGVPATADKAAILAAVEAKASAQAADILAQRGVPSAKTSGIPAGSAPGATLTGQDRLKAALAARRNLNPNN
jgi:ATP-dependent protease ClpP protease subunit